ncbi:MAG: PaaI family thioesterase, partial [Leptospiraceae bacterium]|nr:PaaI family thioesterase [Leptospiraceae bacterium]
MKLPEDIQNLQKIPNRENHKCFACSPMNSAGLKMVFFTNGESVVSEFRIPEHLCGWDDIVHGGIISTILDETMSWSSIYLLKRFILTQSMKVNFIKPIFTGRVSYSQGRIKRMLNPRKAVVEAYLYNEKKELCASSRGIFVLYTTEQARRRHFF